MLMTWLICCFMVNSEFSNTPKSRTTLADSTSTEPMERGQLSPVRQQSIARDPNQISSVFTALSCYHWDAHQPGRKEAVNQTLQTCGPQTRFGLQVDMLIISVHMVVDLVLIEQIYDVLRVGNAFHRPEN